MRGKAARCGHSAARSAIEYLRSVSASGYKRNTAVVNSAKDTAWSTNSGTSSQSSWSSRARKRFLFGIVGDMRARKQKVDIEKISAQVAGLLRIEYGAMRSLRAGINGSGGAGLEA
ncbi:hypothetical protein B0H13DRAFT_1866123 [Mycena leptocephala]|nr:hypothetical protein B0H13DRAFT_1866123 [Mycena leptocephala]